MYLMGSTIAALLIAGGGASCRTEAPGRSAETIDLPSPDLDGRMSLEKAISQRRSIRSFTATQLSMEQIGQLLWAAQGITNERGFRSAPSAGALYPLELYVILPNAMYHYRPDGHRLELHVSKDMRRAVAEAALGQAALTEAPAVFLFTAVHDRTAVRYGERATRYIHMEVGHAAQNLSLQAVALGLDSVPIGAMNDARVAKALSLPAEHSPMYLLPVGHAR